MSDTAARAREQRIAEIRERESKATKGPWKLGSSIYWARVNDGNINDWPWAQKHLQPNKCNWCECAPEFTSMLLKTAEREGHPHHLHAIVGKREEEDWHRIMSWDTGDTIAGNYDYEEGGISSKQEDADFIAHSRADIPFLLEQLAAQSAPVEEVAREIAGKLADLYGESWTELDIKESLSGVIANVLRQHGYGAQGQGVGPRCPKCGSDRVRFGGGRTVFCANDCGFSDQCNSVADFAQFFSPVPPPESATKEGK